MLANILRKIPLLLGAVALAVSGVAAVSAYESHIVNVQAEVENALTVTTDKINFGAHQVQTNPECVDGFIQPEGTVECVPDFETRNGHVFPQEWLTATIPISLSVSFKDQKRVNSVTVAVFVHCKPDTFGGFWMGDAAYLGVNITGNALPGNGQDWTINSAENGWTFIGGDPRQCPSGNTDPGNLLAIIGSKSSPFISPSPYNKAALVLSNNPADGTILSVGLDVPVCDFNYNTATDPKPKKSGYNTPTKVLLSGTGDPRYPGDPTSAAGRECQYDLGMEVKMQVVLIE